MTGSADNTRTRIGWIGTGVMGGPMCGHLLDAGYPVHVYSRSATKTQNLISRGAVWSDTPRAVAEASDVVFSMVGYPADVEAVLLGNDGVLNGARPGMLVIDCTTSEPALAERIARESSTRGLAALDAPVSGGDVGAREATLAIMVGGEEPDFTRAKPLFEKLGRTIVHMGPAGAGQHTKMCNQILAASNMIGVVESLLYAARTGLDGARVIDVIGSGAAASWAVNNLGRRILAGNFEPGFYIKHFVKDLGIALAEAGRLKLTLPGLALAHEFYTTAVSEGLEMSGTQGLYRVLARMNGMSAN